MAVHAVPLYQARLLDQNLRYVDRVDEPGIGNTVDRVFGRTKGAADCFGIIARSCKLAHPMLTGTAAAWTDKVGSFATAARTGLSIPYTFAVGNKLINKFEVKGALEFCSAGLFAASTMVLDKGVSGAMGGWGSTFKTAVDGIELKNSIEKVHKFKKLSDEADRVEGTSVEVKTGIRDELWTNAYKVARFVPAFFSGIIAAISFFTTIVIAKPILIASLVAGLASVIFSFAAEVRIEGARIIPAPRDLNPALNLLALQRAAAPVNAPVGA